MKTKEELELQLLEDKKLIDEITMNTQKIKFNIPVGSSKNKLLSTSKLNKLYELLRS